MPRTRWALENGSVQYRRSQIPGAHLAEIVPMLIADCAGQW
jgi:hypothetical protein